MPTRETGIKGYVGEQVVKQWLNKTVCKSKEYNIVSQVKPVRIDNAGGPYLDFAVIKNRTVIGIYEVKTQEYICGKDFQVNKALSYIWKNIGKAIQYKTQDGFFYWGTPRTKCFLILLVGANKNGRRIIGKKNLRNVIMFSEICKQVGKINTSQIVTDFKKDLKMIKDRIFNTKHGNKITQEFIKFRTLSLPLVEVGRTLLPIS